MHCTNSKEGWSSSLRSVLKETKREKSERLFQLIDWTFSTWSIRQSHMLSESVPLSIWTLHLQLFPVWWRPGLWPRWGRESGQHYQLWWVTEYCFSWNFTNHMQLKYNSIEFDSILPATVPQHKSVISCRIFLYLLFSMMGIWSRKLSYNSL